MINDITRGEISNTLVFHDFSQQDVNLTGLFYNLEMWFQQMGLTPNRISGRAGKNIGFEREKKRLEKGNFGDLDNGFWIAALPPKVGTEMFDFICAAHLDCDPGYRGTLLLCWDDQLDSFQKEKLNAFVKDLTKFTKPAYGYAYQMEFHYGPSFYPFGVIVNGGKSLEEREKITCWGNAYSYESGSYRTGHLRDIYPMNLLSEPHLNQQVFDTNLQNWIESSPDHGELKKLTETLWEWWVPEDKIEPVRDALKPTGILLCA